MHAIEWTGASDERRLNGELKSVS